MTETARISTSISPKYVQNWDVTKAIREIVQNYLDGRRDFHCDGFIRWVDGRAFAKDYGPGIQLRHFALGISEKGPDAIGKYGEGLKLAMLVFAREGRFIEVRAHGKKITPAIELDPVLGTDVLVFYVTDMRHGASGRLGIQGTCVEFECSPVELATGKAFFTEFMEKMSGFQWLERGRISTPGGMVFINGSAVGKLSGAIFSYHLSERDTGNIGNRDREVIDQDTLRWHVSNMMAKVTAPRVATAMMEAMVSNPGCWEMRAGMNEYALLPSTRAAWKRAFHRVYGKRAVISDPKDNDADVQARYRGHETVVVPHGWRSALLAAGVGTSAGVLRAADKDAQRVPESALSDVERRNLIRARRLVEANYRVCGKVLIGVNLDRMAGMAGGASANGLYDPSKDVIWLRRSQLADATGTLRTLLHECVHKHSHATDCTAEFETALCDVSVAIMERADANARRAAVSDKAA